MKIFFIDRCPKDVPTNTKLVSNNSFHHKKKPFEVGWTLPLPVSHHRVKVSQLLDLVSFDLCSFQQIKKIVSLLNYSVLIHFDFISILSCLGKSKGTS